MIERGIRSVFLVALLGMYASVGFGQSISLDDALFKGEKNARITLIEFADYQCPFCGDFYRETLPQIEKNYINTGKVKYVFRNFPLESHPHAFKAAEAANCAGEQGRFWAMHDRLFTHQENLGPKELLEHAKKLALNYSKFTRCLDGEESAAKIRKDLSDGKEAGVKSTPTFFLGFTEPKSSSIKTLQKILGAQPYSTFKQAFDGLLAIQ